MNATEFENHRRHLTGVAYRMLGTLSDAEDVVQETYVRFAGVDVTTVRDVRGWLTTTVARICLDELGSARARRERYVGPWLPEPAVGDVLGPEDRVTLDESVSMAMLVLLESLSPAVLLVPLFASSNESLGPKARSLGRMEASRQMTRPTRRRRPSWSKRPVAAAGARDQAIEPGHSQNLQLFAQTSWYKVQELSTA